MPGAEALLLCRSPHELYSVFVNFYFLNISLILNSFYLEAVIVWTVSHLSVPLTNRVNFRFGSQIQAEKRATFAKGYVRRAGVEQMSIYWSEIWRNTV